MTWDTAVMLIPVWEQGEFSSSPHGMLRKQQGCLLCQRTQQVSSLIVVELSRKTQRSVVSSGHVAAQHRSKQLV